MKTLLSLLKALRMSILKSVMLDGSVCGVSALVYDGDNKQMAENRNDVSIGFPTRWTDDHQNTAELASAMFGLSAATVRGARESTVRVLGDSIVATSTSIMPFVTS